MFDISYHRTIATAVVAGLGMTFPALAQTAVPIDSTLFTTYESYGNNNITWVTCGSTKNTGGCYGFRHVGAFRQSLRRHGRPASNGREYSHT
jgi:hypothetical protein